jgi:hypothetical protein
LGIWRFGRFMKDLSSKRFCRAGPVWVSLLIHSLVDGFPKEEVSVWCVLTIDLQFENQPSRNWELWEQISRIERSRNWASFRDPSRALNVVGHFIVGFWMCWFLDKEQGSHLGAYSESLTIRERELDFIIGVGIRTKSWFQYLKVTLSILCDSGACHPTSGLRWVLNYHLNGEQRLVSSSLLLSFVQVMSALWGSAYFHITLSSVAQSRLSVAPCEMATGLSSMCSDQLWMRFTKRLETYESAISSCQNDTFSNLIVCSVMLSVVHQLFSNDEPFEMGECCEQIFPQRTIELVRY